MRKILFLFIGLLLQACTSLSQNCQNVEVVNEKKYFNNIKNNKWEYIDNDNFQNSKIYNDMLNLKYLKNSAILVERIVSPTSGDGAIINNFCFINNEIKKQEYVNSYIPLNITVKIIIEDEIIKFFEFVNLQTGEPVKIFYKNHKDEIPKNEILKRFKENKPLYFWSERAFAYGDVPPFMKNYKKYRKETLEILKKLDENGFLITNK